MSKLETAIKLFAQHLIAKWQQANFKKISQSPPADTVVSVMDFTQKFSIAMQNEVPILGAHWSKSQVTIHPVVCFYKCFQLSHCTETVTITIIFIKDDTKHDYLLVANVTKLVVKYLLFFDSPGKGPCEAVGGVIKFLVRQAIIGDKDILSSSAADIYRPCVYREV